MFGPGSISTCKPPAPHLVVMGSPGVTGHCAPPASQPGPGTEAVRFYWLVSTPIALAALTVGLFFLAQGKIGKPEQRGRGLLLVIVGTVITLTDQMAIVLRRRNTGWQEVRIVRAGRFAHLPPSA